MGRRLYVFVDESGNHSRRDCYVVAGCWCLTDVTKSSAVLKPTKRKLASWLSSDGDGELKGERFDDETLAHVFSTLRKAITDDESIDQYDHPWDVRSPVAYTLYDSESDLGRSIAERHLGESGTGTTPQVIALASVIAPLFRLGERVNAPIRSYHVVLDDTTWERPRLTVSRMVENIDWMPHVQFATAKSHSTPGIQLADIAAFVRRQQLTAGAPGRASRDLNDLRL
ncbi:DUF3800 domain-containing protein [Halorussus salinus]|uniref:DUF3800 domain-containing protein n=1 Tax=Halorussus salinus TaxID=1364935 RepID=UPI001091EBFF|nr:DUF3800 domain-containing protein [Halorussus salinus]